MFGNPMNSLLGPPPSKFADPMVELTWVFPQVHSDVTKGRLAFFLLVFKGHQLFFQCQILFLHCGYSMLFLVLHTAWDSCDSLMCEFAWICHEEWSGNNGNLTTSKVNCLQLPPTLQSCAAELSRPYCLKASCALLSNLSLFISSSNKLALAWKETNLCCNKNDKSHHFITRPGLNLQNSIDWNPLLAGWEHVPSLTKALDFHLQAVASFDFLPLKQTRANAVSVQIQDLVSSALQSSWFNMSMNMTSGWFSNCNLYPCLIHVCVLRTKHVQSTCLSKILIFLCSGSRICLLLWSSPIWFDFLNTRHFCPFLFHHFPLASSGTDPAWSRSFWWCMFLKCFSLSSSKRWLVLFCHVLSYFVGTSHIDAILYESCAVEMDGNGLKLK